MRRRRAQLPPPWGRGSELQLVPGDHRAPGASTLRCWRGTSDSRTPVQGFAPHLESGVVCTKVNQHLGLWLRAR